MSRRIRIGTAATAAAVTAAALGLAAATATSPAAGATPATHRAVHPNASPDDAAVDAVFDSMTDTQRVGQIVMAAIPAGQSTAALRTAIQTYHIGNVILQGHWDSGRTQVAAVTSRLQSYADTNATRGVKLFTAGDQEGGYIQPYRGAGFSSIPSALLQGTHSTDWQLSQAHEWALELKAAGINLDLAPVADTVPSAAAAANNPPIGQLRREFSYSPYTNMGHVHAFVDGMRAAGVATSVKHFPGLGRVTANTDTTVTVVDSTTTPTDIYLAPFHSGTEAGAPMVMVSLAYYTKIDASRRAAFSPTVINLLRHVLDFNGVVISDSLGAASASTYTPSEAALQFIGAGGDLILQTSVQNAEVQWSAVVTRLRSDPAFKARVYEAVKRVLYAKERYGLLP